jgi:hypothetical protein
VKARWGTVVGLVVVVLAVLPFATAGAQAPPTTGDGGQAVTEGSAPPGGTINCTSGATLDPPNGPPGTLVTVTGQLSDNCDDILGLFWVDFTCTGEVTGAGIEGFSFPMEVTTENEATFVAVGTFTAPAVEPQPPLPDTTEALAVTITCTDSGSMSEGTEGSGTTYVFPAVDFTLELFTDEGEQPTLVDNDAVDDSGVVSGSPTFTG